MLFKSIKEINRLRKEINRLLSKEMSNIYLKVAIEKNWGSQNFDFLSLKNVLPGLFGGAPTHANNKNINLNKNEMELKVENPT